MTLNEIYSKYKNTIKESFTKKVSTKSSKDIIDKADSEIDTNFYVEKTCFLLKCLFKGIKSVENFSVPGYFDEEGKYHSSTYIKYPTGEVSPTNFYYNPKYPEQYFLYNLYRPKNSQGKGFCCSSDIIDQDGPNPYSKDPYNRCPELNKYSDPHNLPIEFQERIYKLVQNWFDKVNNGNLIIGNGWAFRNKFMKPDESRKTKLLQFGLKHYPNKSICGYFAEKYQNIL